MQEMREKLMTLMDKKAFHDAIVLIFFLERMIIKILSA